LAGNTLKLLADKKDLLQHVAAEKSVKAPLPQVNVPLDLYTDICVQCIKLGEVI
jgi:hypothetical protein